MTHNAPAPYDQVYKPPDEEVCPFDCTYLVREMSMDVLDEQPGSKNGTNALELPLDEPMESR